MFVTAIHADVAFADLRDHLVRELAEWNLGIDAEGVLTDAQGRGALAQCTIVPPEAYADRPWHHAVHPCPFVAPLAGYLQWDSWSHAEELIDASIPHALFCVGRGVTARVEEGRAVEAITLQRWPLDSALGKFGFDDGDALLTHDDGPYRAHVLEAIHRALGAAGFEAYLSWMTTCHNPARFCYVQPGGSGPLYPALWDVRGAEPRLVAPDRVLAGISAEVWLLDFGPTRDRDFWALA
jgi:hypothetical protein